MVVCSPGGVGGGPAVALFYREPLSLVMGELLEEVIQVVEAAPLIGELASASDNLKRG